MGVPRGKRSSIVRPKRKEKGKWWRRRRGVRKTVKMLDPKEPSKEEREDHEKLHIPFRNWQALRMRTRKGGGLQGGEEGV